MAPGGIAAAGVSVPAPQQRLPFVAQGAAGTQAATDADGQGTDGTATPGENEAAGANGGSAGGAHSAGAPVGAEGQPPAPTLLAHLPAHVRAVLSMPERETAQRYYSKPFKETRAELIERVLDPPLTLEETARILNVCPMTVRRYTNRGILPHFRTVGDQRRFRLSDVLAFLAKQGGGLE